MTARLDKIIIKKNNLKCNNYYTQLLNKLPKEKKKNVN